MNADSGSDEIGKWYRYRLKIFHERLFHAQRIGFLCRCTGIPVLTKKNNLGAAA
jgi:hypothetical protein